MPEVFVGEMQPHSSRGPLPPHRFSERPRINKAKTAEAGRDIYEDAPWIDIQIDQKTAISHFATPEELREYRASYEQWLKDKSSEGIVGTRLEEWAPMSRSLVEEFRHFKIRTVEDLANIPDARQAEYPEGRTWSARAKAWIKAAADGAPTARLADEYRELKERFAALEKQNRQVMKELEKVTAPEKPKG